MFMAIGVVATAAMYWIERGDWLFALVLFVIGNVGVAGSIVFYESLLPHLVGESELDRVSSAGYALGYLGGGVLLAINVLMIQKPGLFGIPDAGTATRLSMASVAVWWLVFSMPLFRKVPEPPRRVEAGERPRGNAFVTGAKRLVETFRELRRFKQAFLLLSAFLIYNDGIQTIIRMATTYGSEIGIDQNAMIIALLITQFIGVPFAFLFGHLAERIGAKVAVIGGLAVYAGITVLGYYMSNATEFMALALLVGMVQGGTQALSRSMFASMIPRTGRRNSSRSSACSNATPASSVRRFSRGSWNESGTEPQRHPLGARVLRDRRCDPALRQRRRGTPGGARGRSGRRPRIVANGCHANSDRPLARADDLPRFSTGSTQLARPPTSGPLLLLPNHPNALLDPAIVWATAGRDVRFLAKSTLFDGVFRPVLPALVRSRCTGAWMTVSTSSATSRRSPPSPRRLPKVMRCASSRKGSVIRAGASNRFAPAQREWRLAPRAAGTRVALVAVGLNFDRKTRFRSRVVVVYGPPFLPRI